MPIKLNSSGGGSITVTAASTPSVFTATLPASTGTLITTGDTGSITANMLAADSVTTAKILNANVTPAKLSQPLTQMTAQVISGATATVDFTGIPSWVKRITIAFSALSGSGADNMVVQLGTASGFTATGYIGSAANFGSSAINTYNYTVGFGLGGTIAGGTTYGGVVTLVNVSGNTWAASTVVGGSTVASGSGGGSGGGYITLSGALTQVRMAMDGSTNYDGGTINVIYEG